MIVTVSELVHLMAESKPPCSPPFRFVSSVEQGMTEAEEDKLLALKDFMLKSNKAKANMGEQSHLGEAAQTGVIDLATLGITGRQVDLVKPKAEVEDKRGNDAVFTHLPQ